MTNSNFSGISCPAEKKAALPISSVLLSILSGIILTASFPQWGFSFLAWFAFIPLFISIDNKSPFHAFKLGLIAGLSHYLTLLYWILIVLGHYGHLNIFASIFPLILLSLYLSLFPAVFSILARSMDNPRSGLIVTSCSWVGLEYLRSKLMTGFPWCLTGYTQYRNLYLIQIADICGVYGLSFMIVFINILIYYSFFKRREPYRGLLKWHFLTALLLVGGTLVYGHYRLLNEKMKEEYNYSLKAVIIQANIDQSVKWNPDFQTETMDIYSRLTRSSFLFKPDLIIWPETSAPFFFQSNPGLSSRIFSIAEESGAALIFGSPAYKQIAGKINYLNRAYLIPPGGRTEYYDKVHLVPFGEYIPLKKLLFFVNKLAAAAGDFKAGDRISPLNYDDLSIGILICYEAIFPGIARAEAKEGANLLVNITNDAWFGRSGAPFQHLSMAIFRAVETRIPLIRAANTGISAFIDPCGRIICAGSLFKEEVLKHKITVCKSPKQTFYTRFGDIFVFIAIIIVIAQYLWVIAHMFPRTRE